MPGKPEFVYQPKTLQQAAIEELRTKAESFSLICLAFDPDREELAAKCSQALEHLAGTNRLIRLCPRSLHPHELKILFSETLRQKVRPPFYPAESQRAIARQYLHIGTAKRLKALSGDRGLPTLTLAQLQLLEVIYRARGQDKTELRETWYQLSTQVCLPQTGAAGPSSTVTAQLIVPDDALAFTETDPLRKQIWRNLSVLGKKNRKRQRLHQQFHTLEQVPPNTPWRFTDIHDADEAVKQLQARLRWSTIVNGDVFGKIEGTIEGD